jgi:membrane protein YqaA with SNARE-associated domain
MTILEPLGPYLGVFAAAAVPALEVLLVIPPAVVLGLHPVGVAVAAFLGNLAGVVAVVAAGDRAQRWWRARRPPRDHSKRKERAIAVFRRWGLPGLTLVGPLTIGSHLAALLALSLRAAPLPVVAWSAVSLGGWTVVVVAVSATGSALW